MIINIYRQKRKEKMEYDHNYIERDSKFQAFSFKQIPKKDQLIKKTSEKNLSKI